MRPRRVGDGGGGGGGNYRGGGDRSIMEVTFETTRGRRFTVEVWYFSTVRRMKECVQRQEGIPAESQRLFFAGRELHDDRDAEHYAILHGSQVLLVLPDDDAPALAVGRGRSGGGGGSAALLHVVAVVSAGPAAMGRGAAAVEMEIDVDASSCTVARLKRILQERTDGAVPAARAALFFGKAEMEDGKALAEYDPPADGRMEVSVVVGGRKQQQRVSVEVKWGGKTAVVEMGELDAVKELRARLASGGAAPHLALPRDGGYFFIFKQGVMEEERSLRWHDVKRGDTIEIFNGSVTRSAGA